MLGRTKRYLAPWFASVLFSALVLFFQNCTVAPRFQSAAPDSSSKGNGTGYEGKSYVNLDVNGECGDREKIKGRIEINDEGQGQVLRANCVDLDPPEPIEPRDVSSQVVIDRIAGAVIFKKRLFIAESSAGVGQNGTSVLLGLCQSSTPPAGYSAAPLRMDLAVFGVPGSNSAYAVTRSTYLVEQLMTGVKPTSITGDGTCRENRTYISDEIDGIIVPSATSILFYSTAPTSSVPALQILRMPATIPFDGTASTLPVGGVPVFIHTNFIHNLVTPAGPRPELACQATYSNSASANPQGVPIPGICFLHSPVQGI